MRIDPDFRNVLSRVRVGRPSDGIGPSSSGPIAVGETSAWIGNGEAEVTRIDTENDRVDASVDVGNDPAGIAIGSSGVWVADENDNTVSRIDDSPSPVVTETTPAGQGPASVAVGPDSVWVANTQDDTVSRIDPGTGAVLATIAVGSRPEGIAVEGDTVWVANGLEGTLSLIDANSNEVTETIVLGQSPRSVAIADGRVWVSLQAQAEAPEPSANSSDTLSTIQTIDPGSTDPALYSGDAGRAYATCGLLSNYPDAAYPEGSHLVPEIAAAEPEVSDGGRTFTYRIRDDFRFSPPSGEPVTAAAFAHAIERVLDPRMGSYAASFMGDVDEVSARGDRLVVRTVAPAPDLPIRLAAPWFCAVPPDTPITAKGVEEIPTAGPYYVSETDPGRSIVLSRNPNYGGSRPSVFDEIAIRIGVPPGRAIEDVLAGRSDLYAGGFLGGGIPTEHARELDAELGAGSDAAEAGRQQYFAMPQLSIEMLRFNALRAPFDDVRVRRAVNYALDRRALAANPALLGTTATPTDQYIPPGMPGFRDAAIYPLGGPEPGRARRLAGNLDATVTLYTCNLPECAKSAEIVRSDLAAIGLTVEVRQFPFSELFRRLEAPGEPFDIAQYGWAVDFADPFDFINRQFDPASTPVDTFDDPGAIGRMKAAAELSGERRYDAYAALDRDLAAREAPAAAYASPTTSSIFSERIGCQIKQPIYGIDLAALCLR